MKSLLRRVFQCMEIVGWRTEKFFLSDVCV